MANLDESGVTALAALPHLKATAIHILFLEHLTEDVVAKANQTRGLICYFRQTFLVMILEMQFLKKLF